MIYAVGEILLVVVGILIALQINNWNHGQREKDIVIKYYKQILVDFAKEKDYLDRMIQFNDSSLLSYEEAQKVYEKTELTIQDIASALLKVNYTSQYLTFNLNTVGTLETTGDIKLLNPIIRDKLISLKRDQENTTTVVSANHAIYLSSFMKAAASGWNRQNSKLQNHEALRKLFESETNQVEMITLVEAAYALKNYTESELKTNLDAMLDNITEIEKLINNELERLE